MLSRIAHRGPDGDGVYVHENVALGHKRLAILDLTSAGKQPMSTEDGSLVITFNGRFTISRNYAMNLSSVVIPFPQGQTQK